MNKLKGILLIFIALFIVSCQYDPYANKYTTKKPKESELVGKYVFSFQTVDTMNVNLTSQLKEKILLPEINIYKNGTYSVTDLPVFDFFIPTKFKDIITANGNWKITTVGTIDYGNEKTEKHYGIELLGLPTEVINAGLTNNTSPYGIIFGFGDPDQGNVMVFEKK